MLIAILGHFTQHSGEILFALTTLSGVSFCDELREYAADANKIINVIEREQSRWWVIIESITEVKVKKKCPYKKLFVCLVPEYYFQGEIEEEIQDYYRQIQMIVRKLFHEHRDLTFYLSQSVGEGSTIPSQTVIALLIK
jgi:tRNA1(Val) A37 N6-methylase TrmN6